MHSYLVYRHHALLLAALLTGGLASCHGADERITLPPLKIVPPDAGEDFPCFSEKSQGCRLNEIYYTCERVGEFLRINREYCAEKGLVCDSDRGCVTCIPDQVRCDGNQIERCRPEADGFDLVERCDLQAGYTCKSGHCEKLCDIARGERSYVGCEFYAVDLDNAAIDEFHDASRQQFAVVVSNLQEVSVDVYVEINQAPFDQPIDVREVARATVPSGDSQVFALPRREVDGSSPDGLNDGTHTAVTSNAYRVVSSHPIIAYQFNPLDNVPKVFSNDASLLLPISAIGNNYTVVGWPQTIGNSSDPKYDFDYTSDDEDLRAFLTIVGTTAYTDLRVTMGSKVVKVAGAPLISEKVAGELLELQIGPFDVVNLETEGFMADFTGTTIEASAPVSVFVGSEASDVPIFGEYETRQCCADHLEEQLFPDSTLGFNFIIARMPPRTNALNHALENPGDAVAEVDEPEWVRIVAAEAGITVITTTLPPPFHRFGLEQHQDQILRADRDFEIVADQKVAVLQAMASQEVVGIPKYFPGGDPSIIMVPPVEQYRNSYVFLTPDEYAFDFVTITARTGTQVRLDGRLVEQDPHCGTLPIRGNDSDEGASESSWQAHRCSFSSPVISGPPDSKVLSYTDRREGVHTIESDQSVGIVVYGFDRFVSYAYTGGLNLELLL